MKNAEKLEDENIIEAEFQEAQDGKWGLFFVVEDGESESYFTEKELLKFIGERPGNEVMRSMSAEYEFMIFRLATALSHIREGSHHMASACLLADISRMKGALLEAGLDYEDED